MIERVIVRGKDVTVQYESGKWAFYRKKEDIPSMMKGIQPLPKTVIDFMRKHPNKVG